MPEPSSGGPICPVRWAGQQVAVALPEQLGLSNAGPVAEQLLALLDRHPAVLIADMAATRSCDHAGTGVLERVCRQAAGQGTALRLVVPARRIRRILALSGLDRLVPVYSTADAAQLGPQLPAVVVPLPRVAGSDRLATPSLTDGQQRVSRLPAGSPADCGDFERAMEQGTGQEEFDRTLTRITAGVFRAGLALQSGLDQPAEGLRQAAEHSLDLLDETIREARDVAFANLRELSQAATSYAAQVRQWADEERPRPVSRLGP